MGKIKVNYWIITDICHYCYVSPRCWRGDIKRRMHSVFGESSFFNSVQFDLTRGRSTKKALFCFNGSMFNAILCRKALSYSFFSFSLICFVLILHGLKTLLLLWNLLLANIDSLRRADNKKKINKIMWFRPGAFTGKCA